MAAAEAERQVNTSTTSTTSTTGWVTRPTYIRAGQRYLGWTWWTLVDVFLCRSETAREVSEGPTYDRPTRQGPNTIV